MIFEPSDIPDVIKITPKRYSDDRGHFVELFRDELFRKHAGNVQFVQHNQSLSRQVGTIRGLHFQAPPAAQGKLVRCVRGAIFDVAVDLRRSSPTFGRHVSIELTAERDTQLWIPAGFAHGFCTLAPETEVWYAVTHGYSPESEGGIIWNDPALGIAWPSVASAETLSAKDTRLGPLSDLPTIFP